MLYHIFYIDPIQLTDNISGLKWTRFIKGLNNHNFSFGRYKFDVVHNILAEFLLNKLAPLVINNVGIL